MDTPPPPSPSGFVFTFNPDQPNADDDQPPARSFLGSNVPLSAALAAVVIAVVCAFKMLLVGSLAVRRLRRRQERQRSPATTATHLAQTERAADPALEAALNSALRELPTCPHASFDKSSNCGTECSICLGEYAPGDLLTTFPCGHSFHTNCAQRWILTKSRSRRERTPSCPLCKQPLFTELFDEEAGSSAPARVVAV